jgi:GntR family transcriptional regulator/MocR family aminotransferase
MRKEYPPAPRRGAEAFRASPFAHRIAISEQGAGLQFLLRLETDRSDGDLRQRAEGLGVRLGFLSEYAAVPDGAHAHTLVVNYGGLEPADLPEAMALLAEVFAE